MLWMLMLECSCGILLMCLDICIAFGFLFSLNFICYELLFKWMIVKVLVPIFGDIETSGYLFMFAMVHCLSYPFVSIIWDFACFISSYLFWLSKFYSVTFGFFRKKIGDVLLESRDSVYRCCAMINAFFRKCSLAISIWENGQLCFIFYGWKSQQSFSLHLKLFFSKISIHDLFYLMYVSLFGPSLHVCHLYLGLIEWENILFV